MKVYKYIMIIILVIVSTCFVFSRETKAYGLVEYLGDSEKFIFSPGSKVSKKELFVEHGSVMPGDKIEDVIEIRNKASEQVNIQAYVRAIEIDESKDNFLSYVTMNIKQNEDNVLLSGKAAEATNLRDWLHLGDIKSGDKMAAVLELDVPSNIDNTYSLSSGELRWQFKVVEIPVEEVALNDFEREETAVEKLLSESGILKTGDNNHTLVAITLIASVSLFMCLIFGVKKKKGNENEKNN